jgi:amino acid transporter
MQFNRSINSVALMLTALGSIIGSGWLFGPMFAAQVAGPAAVLTWVIGGILMMIIALNFAELATAFPVAGGMVRFADFSFGPLMSFTVGWMVWLSSVVVAPVEVLAMLQYATNYFPGLIEPSTRVLTSSGMVAAATLMAVMVVLNFYGAKFFSRTSTVMVLLKLIVPIVVLCTLFSLDFHTENFSAQGFMPQGWHGVLAALPLGGVIFSYIGYSSAIQLAEEAKNPQRAIPFAIIGSLSICIVLYVLLQLSFVAALPSSAFAHGWAQLKFAGDLGPFAGILAALGIGWLVFVIYGDAIISPFGTAYIYTAATARVSYAMVETKFFPEFFKKLNLHGVPARALLVNYGVGLILFLPFPGWQSMVSFIISCFVISYIIGPIALITLRHTHAEQPRPFLLPGAPFLAALGFYISNLLVYWTGWNTVWKLMVALAVGMVVFIIRYLQGYIPRPAVRWRRTLWLLPYFIGMGLISYYGAFGGTGAIAFGWDFLVMGIFSLWIFMWAVKCGRANTA